MRFILTYEGPLPANGTPAEKNHIRLALNPQLEELWQYEHALSNLRAVPIVLRGEHGEHGFKPIVTTTHFLVAQLEVTLLQRGDPGTVIHRGGGDLDNRLKTLFDSLGVPNNGQLDGLPPATAEFLAHAVAAPTIYVLLEDDVRITRLEVKTDKLLRPGPANDVQIMMVVTVRPTRVTEENRIFLGGWIS
jgi:hypothetical protein